MKRTMLATLLVLAAAACHAPGWGAARGEPADLEVDEPLPESAPLLSGAPAPPLTLCDDRQPPNWPERLGQ